MERTLIGCPDCSGVLSVEKEGVEGHLLYVCHIGHSFSLHSLLEAKEEQLEHALWSAVSLLQHVAMVCTEVKTHTGSMELKREVENRIAQVQEQEKAIRALIEQTSPPTLESGDDAGCRL